MDRRNQDNVTDSDEQEAVMVRYLLGQSPEEERSQVEERYFSDGAFFDQLRALEDSLIDDFVSGRMPPEQLTAFKESLSVRQDDVRFTRALFEAVTQKKLNRPAPEPERRLPAPQRARFAPTGSFFLAASFAALVLLALSFALFSRNQTLKNRLSETEAQIERLKEEKEAAEQELGQARSQTESSTRELEIERNKRIAAENSLQKQGGPESPNSASDSKTIFMGASFIFRGATGATKEVGVSESIRWLRFVVPVKGYGEYESYRISIKLAGQGEVFDKGLPKLTGASHNLVVTVPVTDLRPGDYILTLYGKRPGGSPTELEQYSFRIIG